MTPSLSKMDYLVADRGNRLQRQLDKLPGIESVSAHQWHWMVNDFDVDVIVEPGAAMQIRLDVAELPPPAESLHANRNLPGNLRYATCERRSLLLADTQLDGDSHLLRTFSELKAGLLLTLGHELMPEASGSLTADEVRTAIAACRWPEGSIVHLDGAWEFRPRLRGDVTPVRAVIDRGELRVYRTVVADHGKGLRRDAVCAQALRFNRQVRHARLSVVDGAVVAESRLHGEQLTPAWLETAAWAVAVACRHTEAVLNILAENDDVAHDYVALLLRGKQ